MEIPETVKELWRKHCIAVAELALKIAEAIERNGYRVDKESVLLGALLHDLGRAITHDPFLHFIKSAELLKAEGFEEKIVKIVERHFSAGITAEEAEKLGLGAKDYLPESLEEKIVSFADNITFGDTVRTRQRAIKMKEEIEKLSGMRF
ncbi:MAG: uncharacterized protein PWQ22_512 [Archaeoglobaceae archaeon]|nr:uncharacterized protein [Archaeoglobaceae archaeon]